MTWFERIHIRTFSNESYCLLTEHLSQISSFVTEKNLDEFKVFTCPDVAYDIVVILEWGGTMPQNKRSVLGEELTQILSVYGSCNRSTWESVPSLEATSNKL